MDKDLRVFTDYCGYLANVEFPEQKTGLDVAEAFANEIAHFVHCAANNEPCLNPAEDGVELMKILCAIYRSAECGHEVTL